MIDDVRIEPDEDGWLMLVVDAFGTSRFVVDPAMVDAALEPWRAHMAEGEAVQQEFIAAGRVSWREYMTGQSRTDPEWTDGWAA